MVAKGGSGADRVCIECGAVRHMGPCYDNTEALYTDLPGEAVSGPVPPPPADNGLSWLDPVIEQLQSIRYVADACGADGDALTGLMVLGATIQDRALNDYLICMAGLCSK